MKHETSRRKTRIGPFHCPTVLDETVKRRLVDVWATKICQVFVDLAEAQNADSSTDQT
jgi:ribosomal protein L37AE/L43A